MKTKVLSLLLAITMITGILPMKVLTVQAQEMLSSQDYSINGYSYYDEINQTYWYKSGTVVEIKAPDGFNISKTEDGTFSDSVSFYEGENKIIYLKQSSDGYVAEAISINENIFFDGSAPAGKITIGNSRAWEKLLNNITFGLFFKDDVMAEVTAIDAESGVKSIEYYVANEELLSVTSGVELENAIGNNWNTYNDKILLNKNAKNIIYVKITDYVDNVTYISSDGIVLDSIAPSVYGIENGGVYYGKKIFKAMDDNFLKIELDGVDITDTTEGDDEYKLFVDNEEHVVTVTDKAGNVTEYKIIVYKNYVVTYMVDGEAVYDQIVGHGQNATHPIIPERDGYVGKWDNDGKNITEDTIINAVYTEISVEKPDEVKPEENTGFNDSASPSTGDNSSIGLWFSFLLASSSVFLFTFGKVAHNFYKKRDTNIT